MRHLGLRAEIHTSIDEIPAQQWNRLVIDNYPFMRHEFLAAMEHHGCVGQRFGWLPRHVGIYDADQLVAAMPLYEKHNSYGEFVFDHQWEHAWNRAGLAYFPKLVAAIPYTPATGQRMLVTGNDNLLYQELLRAAQALGEQIGSSGTHLLFPTSDQQSTAENLDWLVRRDVQFHWQNHDYQEFDDFLEQLSARKRKAIRRERRMVVESGVQLRRLDGLTATHLDWQHFNDFYQKTFEEKWGVATFNLAFFEEVAQHMPENIVLVMADLDDKTIAGALMYRGDTHLYGRHWGCTEQVDMLHFEACYYQGIEYAIEHNITIFEPGAQGEHKIARGFLPTITTSAHWVYEDNLRAALREWTAREAASVEHYFQVMQSRSPYRKAE